MAASLGQRLVRECLMKAVLLMSYLSDILEQPQVLRSLVQTYSNHTVWATLSERMQREPWQKVVLTGMGGSYYALLPLWLTLNQQGIPSIVIEASELIHYAPELVGDRTLLIIASQSGESVEVRRLVAAIQGQVTVISVTNAADNFLNRHSDFPLATAAGREVPVATKTYTSSLALLHLLGQALTGQLQPQDYEAILAVAEAMVTLLDQWQDWLAPAYQHLQSTTFLTLLGRGPAVASAMNGALILKEAARFPALGLSGGQFRHGPMEAVSPAMGTILFANHERTWELSQRLATEIASHGGHVVGVGPEITASGVVSLRLPAIAQALSPVLEIVVVQLLAAQLAEAGGIVPGEFRWSGKVIQVE